MALQPLPHPSVPMVDIKTGLVTPEWFSYFRSRHHAGLGDLQDVSLTSPANGAKLTYNSTSKMWEDA